MSRRNEGSFRERNGIGSTAEHTTWTRPGPDPAAIARMETELADTRAALNLACERAEDAEADLEEARLALDQFRSAPVPLPIRPAPAPSAETEAEGSTGTGSRILTGYCTLFRYLTTVPERNPP
jgi:hypothetical protein